MNTLIETIEYKGKRIEIHIDEGGVECPIEGQMQDSDILFITLEKRSTLSDHHPCKDPDDIAELKVFGGYVEFPLYKYEHGRVAYNITGFSCPWDSGRVGSVLVKASVVNPKQLAENLCQEVTAWANDVYGWVVEEIDDSCWGYYVLADCIADAKSAIDCQEEEK